MIRASTLTTIKPKTPQPITPDIAHIIGQAIIEAGRNSDKAALSIADALKSLLPQPVIEQPAIEKAVASVEIIPYVEPYHPPVEPIIPSSWDFKIVRNSDGAMARVKATSGTSFWDFDIVRNQDGDWTRIKATSPTSSLGFKVIRDSDGDIATIKATTK